MNEPRVTANLEALLAELETLRRENRQLRLRLERWENPGAARSGAARPEAARPGAARNGGEGSGGATRVTSGAAPSITPALVARWVEALERQPGWGSLRLGPPGGLRELVEVLRAQAWNPSLTLEQQLDRRQSGLGAELAAALAGPPSRGRWAVRAAFALYGPSASEWLSDEPRRVVQELARRLERLESRRAREPEEPRGGRSYDGGSGGSNGSGGSSGSKGSDGSQGSGGPSSSNGSGDSSGPSGSGNSARDRAHEASDAGKTGSAGKHRNRAEANQRPPHDPHQEALQRLGLEAGASREAIKRAYRRLAKRHHPDLGGDGEAFRALEAAYRLLLGLHS